MIKSTLFVRTAILGALGGCVAFWASASATVTNTAPNITFTASGTFAATPVSGDDTLRLAGQPFNVSVVANAATAPSQSGPNWAVFSNQKMTGTVYSGLLGNTPVNIASNTASITQAIAPGEFDLITIQSPVVVVGIQLTIKAPIAVPPGTIPNQLLHPFAPVALAPGNANVSYTDGSATTVLAIQSGSISGTLPK